MLYPSNLSVTGKFSDFAWSHGDDYSLPHSQFELLAQDELHGFAVAPHRPGVIQHCAITLAGTIMKDHLKKNKLKNTIIIINTVKISDVFMYLF